MSPEKVASLRKLFDRVDADLRRLAQTDSFAGAIAKFRTAIGGEGPAFAEWLHHRARSEFAANEPDTVDPKHFDKFLAIMEDKEKFLGFLDQFPEEAAPEIEQALLFLHRRYFPEQREAMISTSKRLPGCPAGGRPVATPDQAERKAICEQLAKLDAQRTERGIAQRRVAKRHSKSLREIQRIWKECQQKSDPQ